MDDPLLNLKRYDIDGQNIMLYFDEVRTSLNRHLSLIGGLSGSSIPFMSKIVLKKSHVTLLHVDKRHDILH